MCMKAMYIEPQVEIAKVGSYSLLVSISGPDGLKEGGVDDGTHAPQAPKPRPF